MPSSDHYVKMAEEGKGVYEELRGGSDVRGDRTRSTGAERYKSHESLFEGELENARTELEKNSDDVFELNHVGLSSEEAVARLAQFGPNQLPDNTESKWLIFGKLMIQPMALMIWLAAIVEAAILNFQDMSILIMINLVNGSISFYETVKAGDAVAALKASLRPVATVKRDGAWQNIDASTCVRGDLILLAAGSSIPADCRINKGQLEIDQSGLTGESLPVTMVAGDEINHPKMGSTVVKGEVEATIEFTGTDTVMGQTAALLNQGEHLSNMQKILIRIVLVLVALSLALSAIVFGWGWYLHTPLKKNLGFTVVLIVASIPLAIEIVCTTTLALGSRQLSAEGAIVSRLTSIEDLAGMDMLCSDKTGTLTMNDMQLQQEAPAFMEGMDLKAICQYAAMAAKWKEPPRDAIDRLVHSSADIAALEDVEQLDYIPFDPVLKRTESEVRLPSGETFKVSKGAPHVIIDLCEKTEEEHAHYVKEQLQLSQRGIRAIMIARTNAAGAWKAIGMLTFLDPPRPDSKKVIAEALGFGVPVKMITGDHLLIAKEMAKVLDLHGDIQGPQRLPLLNNDGTIPKNLVSRYGKLIRNAGGFAQVFPQHKYLIVKCLQGQGFRVGMTGDGVNDAPALKCADVGIAVSGSTDAARLAADIVLTREGLFTIINGIVISREIFQRIYNFLVYRIAASMQLLIFFFVAVLSLSPSSFSKEFTDKEFKMPVLLLMLITLLNDGTLITIGYDNVRASPYPCVWNTRVLFFISLMLGTIAWVSNFLLLWAALDSHSPTSILAKLGVEPLNYGQITTLVYMKVSITDFLTLFSSRGGEGFFWEIRPAGILLCGAFFALGLSTALALLWPKGKLDDCDIEGLVHSNGNQKMIALYCWIFCILCWFLQDALKVLCYKIMRTWNLMGIADDTHMTEDLLNSWSSSMNSKGIRSKSIHASRDRMTKGSLNN